MPTKKNSLYTSYVREIYSNLNSFDPDAYKSLSHTLVRTYGQWFPQNKHASILDVGCGAGFFLYALRSCGYDNIRGIDLSSEQVDLAKSMELDVSCTDGFAYLKESANHYDFIISTDILEHLTRDEVLDYVQLVYTSLKPGGRFLCSVPNANSPFAARLRYKDLTHEQSFTEESLRQLFLHADLTPEHIDGERISPGSIQAFLRVGASAIFHAVWRVFMFADIGREASGVPLDFKLVGVGRK